MTKEPEKGMLIYSIAEYNHVDEELGYVYPGRFDDLVSANIALNKNQDFWATIIEIDSDNFEWRPLFTQEIQDQLFSKSQN